jgi:hypothetical protein
VSARELIEPAASSWVICGKSSERNRSAYVVLGVAAVLDALLRTRLTLENSRAYWFISRTQNRRGRS